MQSLATFSPIQVPAVADSKKIRPSAIAPLSGLFYCRGYLRSMSFSDSLTIQSGLSYNTLACLLFGEAFADLAVS
jgi:hypothetical protein